MIAINGFGRIGRAVLRAYLTRDDLNLDNSATISAINDIADPNALCHLFNFDSTHGRFYPPITFDGAHLCTPKGKIAIMQTPSPNWQNHTVLECSATARDKVSASVHLANGAGRVIIGAAPFDDMPSVVMGVNDDRLKNAPSIMSALSCTTQALAPILHLLDTHFGIQSAMLTEIHAVTSDQMLLDGAHRDIRRGRAAINNIIPTTSSAINATCRVLPHLMGKLAGHSIRVPVANVAAIDVSVLLNTPSDKDTLNDFFKLNQSCVIGYSDLPLVSSDYIGDTRSAVIDGGQTMCLGHLAKIYAWYDNETAYAHRLLDMALLMTSD